MVDQRPFVVRLRARAGRMEKMDTECAIGAWYMKEAANIIEDAGRELAANRHVFCRDCMFYRCVSDAAGISPKCGITGGVMMPYDFCSRGKPRHGETRKEDE